MKIVVASDHVGYTMKNELTLLMQNLGHTVIDVGTDNADKAEYPLYGRNAAEMVHRGEADRAVMVCGTGFGISLAANTVRGVRCVNCSEPYTARLSRLHNNANALALGARVIGSELAKMIVEVWLSTDFEGGRHAERIAKVDEMELSPIPGDKA